MSKSSQQKFFEDIIRWQQSGLSQKAWCEENNISYGVFHYWYRRFRNQQTQGKQSGGNGFVELRVQDRSSGIPWCEWVLGSGQRLVFHQPVAAEFIRSLLC
jgi:hypothetical protein